MSSKKLNPHAQDFHAISSLIQHYNPGHKKNTASSSDLDIPEPESCPQPHGSQSVINYLSVPGTNQIDSSFRSLSSRGDISK